MFLFPLLMIALSCPVSDLLEVVLLLYGGEALTARSHEEQLRSYGQKLKVINAASESLEIERLGSSRLI